MKMIHMSTCNKCDKFMKYENPYQIYCSDCSKEFWKAIDSGFYDREMFRADVNEIIPLLEPRES